VPREIILFERLRLSLIPFIIWYLVRGYEVRYLHTRQSIVRSRLLRPVFRNGRLRPVPPVPYDFQANKALNRQILERSDDRFRQEMGDSGLAEKMRGFFHSSLIDLVFKKSLSFTIVTHSRIELLLSDFIKGRPPQERIMVVPEPRKYKSSGSPEGDKYHEKGILIPPWARVVNLLSYYGSKMKWLIAFLIFPVWILARIGVPSLSNRTREKFHLGIRVYRTDIGFGGRIRSIDFILDGQHLHRGNTIFCLETGVTEEYRRIFRERNYHFVELPKILKHADIHFISGVVIKKFLPFWFSTALRSASCSPLMLRTTLEVFDKYLTWTRFFTRYSISKYISYNDFREGSTVRNLIFTRNGVKSYYYIHSSHFFNLFLDPGCEELQTVEFMFLSFDCFVGWGEKVARAFRSPHNFFANYLSVGSLWSEYIAGIIEAGRVPALRDEILRKVRERSGRACTKIIGVYDTSFGTGLPLQEEDVISFIEGVLELLDLFPDIVLVFKNKNPLEDVFGNNPQTKPYYDRLRTDPRCFISGDLEITSEELIAASDLCINACFTAPAAEALGARKKTLFFDATGKFRGSYFDQFPFLVAHGDEELNRCVKYWISEITDDEFARFLDTRIRGEVDAYVDGKGITRFRTLLLQP